MNRRILYIIIGLFLTINSFAQTDTEFWFAAPSITSGHENTPIVFRITSYDKPAIVTIQAPANSFFTPIVINLASNSTITQDLTAYINAVESRPSGSVLNTGIKITSTANISAYYEVGFTKNPEIFPLKGNSAKGNSFIIPSQNQFNNQVGLTPNANNGFVIVATDDNTDVTITLTQPDGTGHPAGTFLIKLNKGQSYAVVGASTNSTAHLGGTVVTSSKAICITIYDDSIIVGTSWDLVGDQIVPVINTGTEFIIVRGALSPPNNPNSDYYYIYATEDGTAIYEYGSTIASATINKGNYYRGVLASNSVYITTSKPVYVLQLTGVGTEAAETSLPSVKCTGSSSVSFVRSTNEAFYLNIICKAADVDNFLLNGVAGIITSSLFFDVPGTVGWKAARISTATLANLNALVPNGVATFVTNSTGLFHLGFLNGGALTGARLGYFSNYSKVAMAPNIITSSCMGSDIQLSAKQLNNVIYSWTGPNNFTSTIYNPIISKSSTLDSGYYYVEASIPGCGTSIDSIHITINPLPQIQLVKSLDTVCIGSSRFINYALTGKAPWNVVYSDGVKIDTLKNISTTSANFKVSPIATTIYEIKNVTDSNACNVNVVTSNLLDTMIVNKLPVPKFNYSAIHCEKSGIIFTDQSSANLDTVAKWNWDMGNGVTINASNANPFSQVFNKWGKDTVKLSVVSSYGCKSDTLTTIIDINPLPVVGFTIPNVCLDGGMAVFKDTTSYKNTPTSFAYNWNFNAAAVPISPAPTYTPSQVTKPNPSVLFNIGGDYLVQLKVTTSDGCIDSLATPFTINGSNPISNFKVLQDTALCSNQDVVIKDSSWVYPGKVGLLHIVWGDGKDTTITDSKIGNLYKHFYANAVASNNYNYRVNVQAYSGGTCFDDSLTNIHIVTPPTSVSLNTTQNFLCINDSLIIHNSIIGGVSPFNYVLTTDNVNAICKDSMIYGITQGTVNLGIKITDTKNCIYSYQNLLSLNLPVLPIASMIIKDTVICNGDSVTLKGQGAGIYKWYNGNNLLGIYKVDSLRIGSPGNYSLIVNDGKCNSLPTAAIPIINFVIPAYNFTNNLLSCTNGDVTITTNAIDTYKLHFNWDFGDSSYFNKPNPFSHNYKKIGIYAISLKVTNDYCPKYEYALLGDSISIINPLDSSKFTMFLLSDQDTLLTPKRIDAGYTQYTWMPGFNLSNPNIANPIFRGNQSIDYILMRVDPNTGCKIYDTYIMDVSNNVVVAIPKAFTPNGDNLNDVLKIEYGAGVSALNTFSIYNRFGKMVFQTNDITRGWDGKFNGIDQDMDAYTYYIDYVTYKGANMRKSGSFILLR